MLRTLTMMEELAKRVSVGGRLYGQVRLSPDMQAARLATLEPGDIAPVTGIEEV